MRNPRLMVERGRGSIQRILVLMVVVPALIAGAAAGALAQESEPQGDNVWLLLPTTQNYRHEAQDRPAFIAAMAEAAPEVKTTVVNAEGDSAKQLAQAEAALADGADVIGLMAVDSAAACSIVDLAHQSDVPVVAVEIPILGCDVDYIATVNVADLGTILGTWIAENTAEGSRIAFLPGDPADPNAQLFYDGWTAVLQPLLDSGARVAVGETWVEKWDPTNAQRAMEQILTATDNGVDVVLASNDGIAGGAIAALRSQDLVGTVPVTGVDANLPAVQRIIQGEQAMSIYFSIDQLHQQVADIIAPLLKDETPDTAMFTKTFDNGFKEVPWVPRSGIVVEAENALLPVEDGAYTLEELCNGIEPGTGPCE